MHRYKCKNNNFEVDCMDESIKNEFREYLLARGHEGTTTGTAEEYIKRIEGVCRWEKIDWATLVRRIDSILSAYAGTNGQFERYAVVRALKRFEEFTKSDRYKKL